MAGQMRIEWSLVNSRVLKLSSWRMISGWWSASRMARCRGYCPNGRWRRLMWGKAKWERCLHCARMEHGNPWTVAAMALMRNSATGVMTVKNIEKRWNSMQTMEITVMTCIVQLSLPRTGSVQCSRRSSTNITPVGLLTSTALYQTSWTHVTSSSHFKLSLNKITCTFTPYPGFTTRTTATRRHYSRTVHSSTRTTGRIWSTIIVWYCHRLERLSKMIGRRSFREAGISMIGR